MSPNRKSGPIRVGLIADEPLRLAGLTSIIDRPAHNSHARLLPVIGSVAELLSMASLKYLVVDLQSCNSDLTVLKTIRRARPDIRTIVIGPAGDDEQALNAIVGGARAYLDLSEGAGIVRKAIDVVTEGSIWASQRLLSKLIDRLLKASKSDHAGTIAEPTARERQVLELILRARSNREIASELGIEERTVRAHLARLMRKAGVDYRIKLSMSAHGMFQLPGKAGGRMSAGDRTRRRLTN